MTKDLLKKKIKEKPFLIMGILNITKDSFYDGGLFYEKEKALERAFKMKEEGADIIDIGAESSRPFSEGIDENVEREKIVEILSLLNKNHFDLPISVDTTKYSVAKDAIDLGAIIINDISAGRKDERILKLVAEKKGMIVLMHMRGTPKDMQVNPHYDDVIKEVKSELQLFINKAIENGIERDDIIIDPGIGFGKRTEDNYQLIANLQEFLSFNMPVLIGVSRKSLIGNITNTKPEERLPGTIALNTIALLKGAKIFRVHDVKENMQALKCACETLKY